MNAIFPSQTLSFLIGALLLPAVALAEFGTSWEWRNPLPQGSGIKALASSGDTLVATGRAGTVLTTENGLEWSLVDSGTRLYLRSVASFGETFVAASRGGDVVTSTDGGTTWTRTFVGDGATDWETVVGGDGGWVVGGSSPQSGRTLFSADGTTWTARDVDISAESSVWTGTRFVLGGFLGIITSEDGITWTSRPIDFPVEDLVWTGERAVAVGGRNSAAIASSEAGLVWVTREDENNADLGLGYVAFSGTSLVAIPLGPFDLAYRSTDGTIWTPVAVAQGDLPSRPQDVQGDGDTFVVVGDSGEVSRSTDGGMNWVAEDSGVPGNFNALANFDGRFVGAGGDGTLSTSASVGTWEAVSSGNNSRLRALGWNDGLWVAGGRDDRTLSGSNNTRRYIIFTSPDGIVWTDRSFDRAIPGIQDQIYDLTRIGDRWVAAADGVALTSTDGISWTETDAVAPGFGTENRAVAGSGDRIVIVGGREGTDDERGAIHLSTDGGATWTSQFSPVENFLDGLAWTGSQFVAVGTGGAILTSPNGAEGTWTPQTRVTFARLRDVIFAGGQLVAVGGDFAGSGRSTILTSPDGITWTPRTSPTDQLLFSVMHTGSIYVATGYDGTVLTSPDAINWTLRTPPTTHELYAPAATDGTQLLVAGEAGAILATIDDGEAPLAGYAAWQAANFDLPDEDSISSPGDDPDRDGLPNLIEYALISPPRTPGADPGTLTSLPDGALRLTYDIRDDDPLLTATAETSNDLEAFTGTISPSVSDPTPADGFQRLTFTDQPPAGSNPPRFMRVRFSLTN